MKVGDVLITLNRKIDAETFWRFEVVQKLATDPVVFVAVKHLEFESLAECPEMQIALFLEDGTSLGDTGWHATKRKSKVRKMYL